MKVAVLYVSTYPVLTILNIDEQMHTATAILLKDVKLKTILTDCMPFVKSVQELWVIYPSRVQEARNTHDIITNNFSVSAKEFMTTISSDDVGFLLNYCKYCQVKSLKIFDFYQLFSNLVGRDLTVLCSDARPEKHTCIVYSDGKLIGAQEIPIINGKYIADICTKRNVQRVFSSYSVELLDKVLPQITNINTFRRTEMERVVPNLATVVTEPTKTWLWDATENSFILQPQKAQDKEESFSLPLAIHLPKFNLPKIKFKTFKFRNIDFWLNAAGIILAMTLAVSITANKSLPNYIDYFTDKEAEMQSLLDDRKETVNYYQKEVSAMTNGEDNIDASVLNSILAIEPDGVLGGVTIDRNTVEVLVYLKEENEADSLDKYLQAIADTKILINPTVKSSSTMELDNIKLKKYTNIFQRA